MKLLFVTTKLPYPPMDGGCIAVYEPVRRLAQRRHEVVLLCFGRVHQDWRPLEQHCRVELVDHNTKNRLLPALCSLAGKQPYTIAKYYSRFMEARLRHLLSQERFDLVQFEHLHMGHYLHVVREFGLPVLLRQQNVESVIASRLAETLGGVKSLLVSLHASSLRRYESSACQLADLCLTITDVDSQKLRAMNSNIRTAVIPAGVDLAEYTPSPGTASSNSAAFIGSMNWIPNIDAAQWFCRAILPKVRERVPSTAFFIVGSAPSRQVRALSRHEGVIVTGFVPDVRHYLQTAGVIVVPLRVGSGMRLKILQAMAMGKAVVSTSIGAEGIDVTPGHDILIADDPGRFAKCVVDLLSDGEWRQSIGRNARHTVEKRYSWDAIIDATENLYYHLPTQARRR